jgi:uncharacterized protein YggT (Ycf19 family)
MLSIYETFIQEFPIIGKILVYILFALSDLSAYAYTLIKIYRVLVYTKITLDQFPLLNPYIWPFSFFRIVAQPWLRLWHKLLPTLKMGDAAYDISVIVSIEALGALVSFSLDFRAQAFFAAEHILKIMNS